MRYLNGFVIREKAPNWNKSVRNSRKVNKHKSGTPVSRHDVSRGLPAFNKNEHITPEKKRNKPFLCRNTVKIKYTQPLQMLECFALFGLCWSVDFS